jgi:hypothetical protein
MNGGDEDRYLGLLLDAGIAPGTSFNPDLRHALIDAYSGCESLRCGFHAAPVVSSCKSCSMASLNNLGVEKKLNDLFSAGNEAMRLSRRQFWDGVGEGE